MEIDAQFESRKKDHVRIALMPEAQASVSNGLDEVRLIHEALPDINFNDVNITKKVFGHRERRYQFAETHYRRRDWQVSRR